MRIFRFLFLLFLIPYFSKAQNEPLRSVIQVGHGQVVKSSLIDPSGKYLFTASRDKTIKMWDRESGLEIRTFFGHDHTVNDLDIFPKDQSSNNAVPFLASSSADKTARLWTLDGREVFRVEAKDYMTSVAISPDGKFLVCGGYDWHMRIYEIGSGKMVGEIKVAPDKGLGYGINLAFSPDGRWLALGEDNQNVRVFSVGDWGQMFELKKESGYCGGCVSFVGFLPSGELIKCAQNGPLQVIKLNHENLNEPEIKTLGTNEEDVLSIDVSLEGMILVAGEQFVTIINPAEKDTLIVLEPMVKEINEARFTPEGDRVIISGNDNKSTEFSIETGLKSKTFEGIKNLATITGLNYDPSSYWDHYIANWIRMKNKTLLSQDSKELIRGKFGDKVKRWDLLSGRINREYSQNEKSVLAFDLSKDGKMLLTGAGDGSVKIYDYESGDTLKTLGKLREVVFDTRFSHNKKLAVASGWDGYLHLWDVESGEKLPIINFENTSIYTVSFTPNDLYLVLGRLDKKLEIWEPDTRTKVQDLIGHSDVVSQISFNEDGSRMLTSSWDGSAREWDLATGMQTWKAKDRGKLHTATYSPDGKYIVTGGEGRVIKFWDRNSAELLGVLEGHQAPVYSVLFTENGNKVVSVDENGVTKFWDLEKGKASYEQIHIGKNDWMVRTPNGYFNATDGARKFIHFTKGNRTFELDQFFNKYYVSNIESLLTQGRGKSKADDLSENNWENYLPKIKLAAIEKEKGKKALLGVRIYDVEGDIYADKLPENQRELKIFQNGKRARTIILSKKYLEKDGSYKVKLELPLVNGNNVFEATASAGFGVETAPSTSEIFVDKGTPDSDCYLMVVGINAYKNPKLNLNYAKADAESFANTFSDNSKELYNKLIINVLYDQNANKENILQELSLLEKEVGLNDVFIFYYAGHGTIEEGKFFLVPHDATRLNDLKSLEENGIADHELQSRFENIKALKQIIIMDACQSGGSIELLAQRGATEEKAIAQLSRSAGIHVLASAGSEQYATEFENLGHGVFTYSLLEALQGKADGSPEDSKVTIYELKSFLDDQVPTKSQELKGDPQYPYTFSRGQDFPLVIPKK